MPPKKQKSRFKRWSIPRTRVNPPPPPPPPPTAGTSRARAIEASNPSTSNSRNLPRGERISAAERIHQNQGYAQSVKELLRRHEKLTEYEPVETVRDVIRFTQGRQTGVLTQIHLRFRFDYALIQSRLLEVFARLFALQGNPRDAFEVIITFHAILYCSDTNTYSMFYGTDHRENNRMGAANELGYGGTYVVNNLAEVTARLPCVFEMQDLLHRHRDAFPHSNVTVFKITNIIYLIYQFRGR